MYVERKEGIDVKDMKQIKNTDKSYLKHEEEKNNNKNKYSYSLVF